MSKNISRWGGFSIEIHCPGPYNKHIRNIRRSTMEHHNPLLSDLKSDHRFITIGEIMLRLTPPNYQKIRMANEFEATYGGSEANIALALANLGIDWTYQFDHGQNSAYISVEARESHRVRHVLTAMALAAASAVLLRLLPAAVDVVQNYVTQPLPAFVFLSMLSTGLTADVDTLLSYGRMILLFAAFCTVVTAVQFVYVARRTGYPVGKMWEILRPTFMAQLASACSSSAFSDAYDACERGFGMDRRLVRFALPIGTVIHKPLIAAEFVFVIFAIRDMTGDTMTLGALLLLAVMAFLTSVAYPPVSGGEISCYTRAVVTNGHKRRSAGGGLRAVRPV